MKHSPLVLIGLTIVFGSSASAANLPPGFVQELVVSGLPAAMTMAWDPEGRLWIAGQRGNIWRLHLEGTHGFELEEVADLDTNTEGEHGVIGIAIDPDYPETRHVWIFYSTTGVPVRNRLSRFRNVGSVLVEETVILETPNLDSTIHTGGCLRFAADKTLFISTGDDLQFSETAQNKRDIRGKILHINRDGSPVSDNPFIDGEEGDPRVWAYGLRNPWRFNLQPESETLFIADVGASKFEELNLGVRGGNFGWFLTEGPEPPAMAGIIYPVYSYPHTNPDGHAIIGGGHAPATNFPHEYVGNYFFADNVTREIFRMVLDDSNSPSSVDVFVSETTERFGPVDLQFGPDGALYYLTFLGDLFRVSYVGGANRQPVADAIVTPNNGAAPLEVTLDASDSFDPEGGPLSYLWDLGDGTHTEQRIARKSYPRGAYVATITVTDAGGTSAEVRNLRIVSGNHAPEPVIQAPVRGRLVLEDEFITFSGTAIDAEEGIVPCAQFSWRILFHHLGHAHPFLGPIEGVCEDTFIVDSHGEEQIWYEIRLTVKDTGQPLGGVGVLEGVTSVEVFPRDTPQ